MCEDNKLPIDYELIIIYLDENGFTCNHVEVYETMDELLRNIKHFRVKSDCEIIKYEINLQRRLL